MVRLPARMCQYLSKSDVLAKQRRYVFANYILPLYNKYKYMTGLEEVPELKTNGKDVIFITIDCLRANHTTPNYERNTIPEIRCLGDYSHKGISAAPWTFASVPSLLTGKYPHNHGAGFEDPFRDFSTGQPPNGILSDVYTLPELLGASGYKTYFSTAVSTAELPVRGHFTDFNIRNNVRADTVTNEFLSWWISTESPRLGYVQYGDLHEPINDPGFTPFGEWGSTDEVAGWDYQTLKKETTEFKHFYENKLRLYDSALRFIDQQIGRIRATLEEQGEFENTIIIVTGDHGEEFWDHWKVERDQFEDPRGQYGIGHGHTLFQEVINVPIVFKGETIDTNDWRSTVDIVPTIFEALDTSSPIEIDGISLTKSLQSTTVISEEIAYGYEQKAVLNNSNKLIYSSGNDFIKLYDLNSDPQETNDIANHRDQTVEELKQLIPTNESTGQEVQINSKTETHLEDLGYM